MVALPRGNSKGKRDGRNSRAWVAGERRTELGVWSEHVDARRASVYRTDVPFAAEDRLGVKPLTPGEVERIVAGAQALRAVAGWPWLKVAAQLGYGHGRVRRICTMRDIDKLKGAEVMKLRECSECMTLLLSDYWLISEACASVGISNGRSTQEMMVIYLSAYHQVGHDRAKMRDGSQEVGSL